MALNSILIFVAFAGKVSEFNVVCEVVTVQLVVVVLKEIAIARCWSVKVERT